MPQVTINNIDLYYEEHGKGDPLVLISGLSGDVMTWMTVLNVLSRYFWVIIFDNRGAGQSTVPDHLYSISDMADDVFGLLNHLNIEKAHILGHSMGGFIAEEFALRYPEKVNKLVLYATGATFSKRNKRHFTNMYNLLEQGVSRELWFSELYCWLFSKKFFEDEEKFKILLQFAVEYPYQQTLEGFKGQLEACNSHNVTEHLGNISSQTLVLVGEQDILISPTESKILTDHILNSEMIILENSAHSPHIEDKNLFTKTVLEFLR